LAVLVVGGAGYIGSHAAHVLRRKGYDVIIYDDLSNGRKELAEGFELIVAGSPIPQSSPRSLPVATR